MSFKCGIVGLPNVGKSTLFNALTNSSKAQAANFPFCTIEPNVGIVPVPDIRLDNLEKISNSKKKIYTTISFIDIAGLVKGASKGEGLGNKFLSHIREVDAVVHVLRCFDSENIKNVHKNVDPIRDLEVIETEMKLADLETINRRLDKRKKTNNNIIEKNIMDMTLKFINDELKFEEIQSEFTKNEIKNSGLLSIKPRIYVCNVDEKDINNGNNYTEMFIENFGSENTIIISSETENQINQLNMTEKNEYMNFLNMKNSGLNTLIKSGYKLLKLNTFFTSGPEESRAWTITKDSSAPQAAGTIHTDFERGFIRAETVSYKDFVECNGWSEAKIKGKIRLEGKDYKIKDGDVLNFRFNT